MAVLSKLCLRLAIVCMVLYVVTRLGGYADHNPIPLFGLQGGIRPSTFQGFTNTLLFFSIAFGIAAILKVLKGTCPGNGKDVSEPPKPQE